MATDMAAKPKPTTRKRDAAPKPAASKRAPSAKRTAATKTDAAPRTRPAAPRRERNRAAVLSVLDAQERTANAFADYQTRVSELSRIPGAAKLANAQAKLLRRATGTYVKSARELLK